MRKAAVLWVFVILNLMAMGCQEAHSAARQGNLLDSVDEWHPSSWKKQASIALDEDQRLGDEPSWRLHSTVKNDLRVIKTVQVHAGKFYRFSAKVRTEAVSGPVGANLSVYGTYSYSRQTLTGNNEWSYVEQVFRALEDDEVDFALRLGYWNATATGTAWFNEVRLEELAEWSGEYQAIKKVDADPSHSSAPLRFFSFLIFVPFLYLYLAVLRQQDLSKITSDSVFSFSFGLKLTLLLLIALLARLAFAAYMGYVPQLEYYQAWALNLADPFSSPAASLAYVSELGGPLWLYWLSGVGALVKANMLEASPLFTVLLKLPVIVAEMLLVYVILKQLSRLLVTGQFWWQAGFVVFNPALIMVTAFLGQAVALAALFLLLSMTLIYIGRVRVAAVVFAAALAANCFSVILLPALLYLLVQQKSLKTAVTFSLVVIGAGAAFYLPMLGVVMAEHSAAALPHVLSNAAPPSFSLETLFATPRDFGIFIGILVIVAVVAIVLFRFEGERIYEYREQIYSLSFFSVLFAALILPWAQDLFLYLAIVLLVPLLVQSRYHRWAFLIISVLLFIKSVVLFSAVVLQSERAPGDGMMAWLISLTVLALLLIGVGQHFGAQYLPRFMHRNRISDRSSESGADVRSSAVVMPFRLTKFDYLAILAIWVVAFSLVLFDIGERTYPTNGYTVSEAKDILELDLGSPQAIKQIRVYLGASGDGAVRFEGWDGERWLPLWRKDKGLLRYRGGEQYRSTFKLLRKTINGRKPVKQLRISVMGDNFDVNEIAIIGMDDRPIIPAELTVVADTDTQVAPHEHPLFDEHSKVGDQYGYQAMTVWDEVFYARSAYDLLHGQLPFERSHPPLGKSLIAVGIRAFDMTPLGWRVVDAFFVSLLPVLLFIGGRWLTGQRVGAYTAATLAIFEPLFFIHGRWANIDSFLVVFLTACLLILYRWYRQGEGRVDKSNVGWLLAAGVLFGFAISIKWSALFTGFAIFVLFVIAKSFEYTIAQWRFQDWYSGSGTVVKRLAVDVGAWGVCFVLVPISIYYLSHAEFVPTMPGQPGILTVAGIQAFVDQQLYVWTFHSGKHAAHGASSLFFTWPFMWQPVGMFSFGGVGEGMRSSLSMLGNPLIWWPGFVVMLGLGWMALAGRNKVALFLAGIYFLQCLPWLLVGRTTFLYHYYPFLPFVILGIAYVASRLDYSKRWPRLLLGFYVASVVAAFAAFYPLVTTTPVPIEYVDSLRVFPTWSVL